MEPNYHAMSLVELKQAAKGRRIKQYYIMKRSRLIQVLSMNELPMDMKIEKMTIHELRDEAKRKGIRGFWALRRADLVDVLFPAEDANQTATDKNEKNQSDANKHDAPKKHDAEEVRIQDPQDARDDGSNQMNLDCGLSLGS